ncbi:hypothetical protein FS749_008905 [Ceratobasidium sp. UAMH 11750]|nr:hypothetical protein FS749_008905 [Ceratobasidium sp. UAMH 11750]
MRSTHSVINVARCRIGLGLSLEHTPALKTPLLDPPTKTFKNPATPIAYRYSFPSALAPSPLHNCTAYDESGIPVSVSARVGLRQVYKPLEAVPQPGMHTGQSMNYPSTTPYPIQIPSTARQGCLQTPPTITTRALHSPVVTPVTSIIVTPASASTILPVSSIRARFGFPMTHALPTAVFGEGAGLARDPGMEVEEGIEDADVCTGVGSPELGKELWLLPIRTLLPYGELVVERTRRVLRGGGAVSCDVLLYGPAGVTPAPADLAHNNVCDKLPPVPSHVPPHQATFFGVQSVPVADGSGRFAMVCAPPRAGVPIPVSTPSLSSGWDRASNCGPSRLASRRTHGSNRAQR